MTRLVDFLFGVRKEEVGLAAILFSGYGLILLTFWSGSWRSRPGTFCCSAPASWPCRACWRFPRSEVPSP